MATAGRLGAAALLVVPLLVGLAAGGAAAWRATGQVDDSVGRGPPPWKTMAGTGSAEAHPRQRATVARIGIWALPESEVIYFNTETDSEGRPLEVSCDYRLEADTEPKARWWSIGVYRDYFWIDNEIDRYSLSSSNIARTPGGGYAIRASGRRLEGNWLPLGREEGRLTLLFRLYQPDPSNAANPEAVPLPRVIREGCR